MWSIEGCIVRSNREERGMLDVVGVKGSSEGREGKMRKEWLRCLRERYED